VNALQIQPNYCLNIFKNTNRVTLILIPFYLHWYIYKAKLIAIVISYYFAAEVVVIRPGQQSF
jgi:hypothetical protein